MVKKMENKKLRKKIIFTLVALVIAHLLTQIPVYGVNRDFLSSLFGTVDVFGFLDIMSGGSISSMDMAAFGVSSYVTASIIVQLFGMVFPAIEQIQKQGESGRKRIERITVVLSFLFVILYSLLMALTFGQDGLFIDDSPVYIVTAVISWIVGAAVVIALAKQIDERGIGNGMAMVLMTNILSGIPSSVKTLFSEIRAESGRTWLGVCIACLVIFAFFMVAVNLIFGAYKVHFILSRKSEASTDGVIPVSANIANVMPVIFGASLISLPSIIVSFAGLSEKKWGAIILEMSTQKNWYSLEKPYCLIGLGIYVCLVIVFSYFYSSIAFTPAEVADNMKKRGDTIPGINPGNDTASYLDHCRKVMAGINAVFLAVLVVLPNALCAIAGLSTISFMGTSLIIVINVLFDTRMAFRAKTIHLDKGNGFFGKNKEGILDQGTML